MKSDHILNYFFESTKSPLFSKTNKFSVIFIFIVGSYGVTFSIFDAFMGLYNTALVNVVIALISIIALLFFKKKKRLLAKCLMVGGITFILCLHFMLFKQRTLILGYTVPLFMCAIAIFRGADKKPGYLLSFTCLLIILFVYNIDYHFPFAYQLKSDELHNQRIMNVVGMIFLCLIITYFIIKVNENIHLALIDQGAELKNSNAALKDTILTRDKLFSLIAHDLKGPFQSMSASLEILGATDTSSEDKEMVINHLSKKSKNTIILLNNLLLWSQHQTESIKFRPETLKLSSIEKSMKDLFLMQAKEKNIDLQFDMPGSISIYADKNMIECIFRNLISNAIKYTKSGGEIEVSADVKDLKVTFFIKDNGIGMDEIVVEMLANKQPYTSAGTQNEQGHGLGMMLIHEFLNAHKTELKISSKPNVGSEFFFELNTL